MNAGTSNLPNAVLRQLENYEVAADQLLPIQRTMKIAGALLDANEETMRFFLSRKIVTSVVVLLDSLLGLRPETTSSQKERLQTCLASFMLVCVVMRCSNGVPWVVEAFENGLLSLLLKVTDELKSTRGLRALVSRLNGIIGEVLGTVIECMSYYSVITALSTIKGKRNAARAVRAQESGPLKDKWVSLFNLIIERCAIQGLLSARIRNVPIPCDNVSFIRFRRAAIDSSTDRWSATQNAAVVTCLNAPGVYAHSIARNLVKGGLGSSAIIKQFALAPIPVMVGRHILP